MSDPIDLTGPYGATPRGFQQKNIFADEARILGPGARVVVDGGAHHGEEIGTFLTIFPEAIIHAIEPTPASVHVLRQLYGNHPRVRIHSGALAEFDGAATLNAYTLSARNALTPYAPHPDLGRDPDMPVERIEIPTWTLDRFCAQHRIERVDLLKLDTQGAEGRVLAGARDLLQAQRIGLIALEVLFVPLFEDQAEADELIAVTRRAGYSLYDLYNFSYGETGQLLFGDAIFLPKFSRADSLPEIRRTPAGMADRWNASNVGGEPRSRARGLLHGCRNALRRLRLGADPPARE